jgi:quaternary ammonium compound-resistance protein SugE
MVVVWAVLMTSAFGEVAWATMLKRARGFRHKRWLFGGLALELVTVTMLGWTMQFLTLGVAYAAWAGVGTVGTVLVGLVAFGERLTLRRGVLLLLLIGGIVGLQFVE